MIFRLGESIAVTLTGERIKTVVAIEAQTEKGLLLSIIRGAAAKTKWLPKSMVKIDNRKPEGIIDIMKAEKIEIPSWIWEDRSQ